MITTLLEYSTSIIRVPACTPAALLSACVGAQLLELG